MIKRKEVIEIHKILIERFGGTDGIRDNELLESALHRPNHTFEAKELYPTPVAKASAILESIVKNHPFLDGNKRIGYVLARLTLMKYGLDIKAGEEDKYQFVIAVSKGILDYDQIKEWFEVHTISVDQ